MNDTPQQPQRNVNTRQSQTGIIGDGAHVEGGIHFYDSPPSKALSLHQLPPPPDDFTGREAELTELRAALETRGATISGLRGMGGVGKTVLALKLAQELTSRYPDAQFYLDLQGTTQPLTPGQAMAHVIRAYHPTARLPRLAHCQPLAPPLPFPHN